MLEVIKYNLHLFDILGEMYDRRYDWSRIPKESQFGKETPHDNRGTNAKRTLQWIQETQRFVGRLFTLALAHRAVEMFGAAVSSTVHTNHYMELISLFLYSTNTSYQKNNILYNPY